MVDESDGFVENWTLKVPIQAISYNQKYNYVALGLSTGTIQINWWNKTTWDEIHSIPAHTGPVTAVAWNGDQLATGGRDRMVNIFQLTDGKLRSDGVFQGYFKILSVNPTCVRKCIFKICATKF